MFDLDSLNPQQRDAVETVRGPVLILAGAGTGKTRVITCRIAHMIQRGIPPGKILAVTFTNKAAREMVERVNGMIPRRPARDDGEKPERPTVCTFHSLCVRILRQHIERLGYKRNFVIYSESEQLGAIRKILSQIQGEKVDPGAVLGMLSRYRNGGTRAAAFADNNVAALAEHVRKKYESALRACNAVDFDDLLLLVLRLFKEFPDVLEACRARFRFIMVDEYQDTNAVQFELVNHLASEHRNLCVVGDDDQSIYGWRGAEVANLLDLEKHFPEVKVIKLEQNYRSTNIILRAANAVIKNNARRRGKQLWSAKGDGAKLALCAFDTDEDEARTVVEEIEFQRAARRVPWANHAILFRTNLQSRPIETALRKAGVRYHLIGGQSFFDRREVKDLLAYLRVLLNPHDDVSLLRIANTPPRGLSDVTMERLLAASTERQCSVFTTMRHTDVLGGFQARAREAVTGFAHWLESHSAALHGEADFAVGDWADALLKETGYYDDLRKSERETEAGEARVRSVRELLPSLGEAGGPRAKPAERVESFLEEVTLDSERAEEKESAGEAVTLITMHSCKGLEFPHVHVVGLEDGLLPHSRSKVEGTLDEERRLFYVAITRAQTSLRISHCAGRKKYGQMVPCHPSPFLKELPAELVEDGLAKASEPVKTSDAGNLFAAMRAALG